METCDDILTALPRKYVADFIALPDDPRFQQEPDSRNQMVMATQILRQKKERIPFSVIDSFFHVAKGRQKTRCIQFFWSRYLVEALK
jgi:hypothetical protein